MGECSNLQTLNFNLSKKGETEDKRNITKNPIKHQFALWDSLYILY